MELALSDGTVLTADGAQNLNDMSKMQEQNCAGKIVVSQLEEAVKDMIADRLLPADFQLKEIGEDGAWGISDKMAVKWNADGMAYSCLYNKDEDYEFLCWNEDGTDYELKRGHFFMSEHKLDIFDTLSQR